MLNRRLVNWNSPQIQSLSPFWADILRRQRLESPAQYRLQLTPIHRTATLSNAMMPKMIAPPALDFQDMAILLDVDGTVLDLASTPSEVYVPSSLRRTLARLWERSDGALAFVSGRPIGELDLLFSPLQLPAIGGHGAELRASAGASPQQPRLPPLDASVKRCFAAIADAGPGIIIEDKGYSLALHYRLAPEKERIVRDTAAAICARVGLPLELLLGKSMVEIRQGGFTKGTAVRELMSHVPFSGRRPFFIGDDVTDRDVFAIMPDFHGIAVSVGEWVAGADYCFDQPLDVRRWLAHASRVDASDLP
jgi:trehalose 6-phosphate phosphatase